jgi:crotonobetainyl-CoA:carnitine CoA-transferase CaiB-like acyl-CoA transferase
LKINLKDADARELFYKLADNADVLVESFRPGVVKRLGVDYETLSARNPRLVYCSISAFGQEGAYALKPGHALTIEALSGVLDLNRGLEDNKPTNPCIPASDMASSLMALSAIMMALYKREQTGRGDYIDMSMYDALLAWTPNVTGPVFAQGRDPVAKEMRSFGGAAMNKVYETKDGKFLVLGGSELHFAKNILEALGRADLIEYAKLEPGPGQEPLRAFFLQTFLTRTLAQWQEFLADIEVCWAPIRSLKDALDEPYARERGMVLRDAGGQHHLGPPIRFRYDPPLPNLRTPTYGEHSAEIAREAGADEAVIDALLMRGAI